MNKKSLGFSLIELLVVISIIGLLTAIILPALQTAQKKGRVTQRISDIKAVQAALEFYYAANHSYPSTGGSSSWRGTCPSFGGYSANNVVPGLAPMYIPVVPTDPQSGVTSSSCYLYTSNGTDYAFLDYNIPEMASSQSQPNYTSYPELVDSLRGSGSGGAWKVSSSGGINW